MTIFLPAVPLAALAIGIIPNGLLAFRLRFQKDARILNPEKRLLLEEKVRILSENIGIKKKLELREIKGLKTGAQAMGNSLLPGRAGMAIDPLLFDTLPEEQQEFILAHEIAHLKKNDTLSLFFVPALIGVISTVALCILFPPLAVVYPIWGAGATYIGIAISLVAFTIFSRWREKCADKIGQSICSQQAKEAGPQFFEDIRQMQIEWRNEEDISKLSKLFRKIMISKEGNFRLDSLLHPSLKARIKYLRQPIQVPAQVPAFAAA